MKFSRLPKSDASKCKNCEHSYRVHTIAIYADSDGRQVRNNTGKPLGHLTAYGHCSCVEYK